MPYYGRGVAYIGLGQKLDALKDFEISLTIDNKHAPSYCERGLLRIDAGNKETGCIDMRTAIDLGYAKAKEKFDANLCSASGAMYYNQGNEKFNHKGRSFDSLSHGHHRWIRAVHCCC